MAKVYQAGITAVCVEARPHPDFMGEKWWQDMDAIMDEARQRGMKVWLLDDDHFPTGHAAGKMKDAPAELQRLFLKEGHVDVFGPMPQASFLVNTFTINMFRPSANESKILAVVAVRRQEESTILMGKSIDITYLVQDGVLYWDVPEGFWRIFVFITSNEGGSPNEKDYVNVLDADSVKVLIDEVYEGHYQRYKEDFGKTFAGFFSDEPGFYNDKDTFDYNSKLGKKGVDLLWHANLLRLLTASFGKDFTTALPSLWYDGVDSGAVRFAYMDLVSKLYARNFTQQIGDWCREHNVEYIGHVLEDNGVHTRLGAGAGHYFRALWGQDMAGLDVVLWQLAPGFGNGPYAAVVGDADGEFFHFGLGKLGSSLAHIDPKKKGRAMCEVYGAYGWAEGLKLMKWMTDHLMVRGINHFVPHAFSQKDFPDWDCPPHFYARGKNPQYRYYAVLNQYINRVCHLLSGGRHVASAAVLYHAEADWSGDAMPFEKVVRVLMQNQIDCDVLPIDVVLDSATIENGKLQVSQEQYDCLVLPMAEAFPVAFLIKLIGLARAGFPLYFIDTLPTRICEGLPVPSELVSLAELDTVKVIQLSQLVAEMKAVGFYDISTPSPIPDLRHFHTTEDGLSTYLFFNEHPQRVIETEVILQEKGKKLAGYDALSNTLYPLEEQSCAEGVHFSLKLSPYQTMLVFCGDAVPASISKQAWLYPQKAVETIKVSGPWDVSTATAEAYPEFAPYKTIDRFVNLNHPEFLPRFSGTFRYAGGFNSAENVQDAMLDLGEVYETAEVWINGSRVGVQISPPYQFHLSDLVQAGWNELVVDVTNTLVKDQQDFFSRQTAIEPGGLLGPVVVHILKK